MSGPTLTDVVLEQRDHSRRIKRLEDEWDEFQPEVLTHTVGELVREFRQWKWLLIAGVVSIIAAVVVASLS